ncbi:MAG: hypothetical protein ACXWD8_05150 [Mycobacterium sp.]
MLRPSRDPRERRPASLLGFSLATWRSPAPDSMDPFARTIDAAKKYVVSSTLERVDWNAELVDR